MSTKHAGERIYGPYPDRGRYRVVAVDAAGRRTAESFTTEAEAADYVGIIEARSATRTVRAGLEDYFTSMTRKGAAGDSVSTTRYRLEGLHADALADPLGSLSTRRVTALYEVYAVGRARGKYVLRRLR